jgi:chromosome segregation ATPase
LEDRIKDLQSSLETEIDKRQEAEKKEQSAIKHQSTLAREKNEQEAKFTALEGRLKATADEKALLQRRLEEASTYCDLNSLTCTSVNRQQTPTSRASMSS